MASLQLNSALILIIAIVLSNSPNVESLHGLNFYLPFNDVPNPYPLHYDIELTLLDFENTSNNYFNIYGKCNITFQIINPIANFEIKLAPSINIITSKLIMTSSTITYNWVHKRYGNISSYQKWNFTEKLKKGTYIMTLEYNDVVHNNGNGFFRTSYKPISSYKFEEKEYTQWLIATNNQPNETHRIFPCFELPVQRSTFNISIKVHKKYEILTNMKTEYEHHLYPDDLQMKRFTITPEISVYQVAILIQNNFIKVQNSIENEVYSRKFDIDRQTFFDAFDGMPDLNIDHAKWIMTAVTTFFTTEFWKISRAKYPIVSYVIIPGFPYDSADGWRLVFLREEKVSYNPKRDTFGRRITMTSFVAQKVTYQWLGSSVSLYNWSDLWVNDGLAIFYGMKAINESYPEFQMWNLFVVQDMHECLHLDTNSFLKPLYSNVKSSEIDTSFYFSRYLKGPALLQMLYYMTDSMIFRSAVEEYNMHSKFKPTTVDDFWRYIQDVLLSESNKSNFENKTVKEVMDTWTKNNYPIVNVRTSMEKENVVVTVTQENSDQFNEHKWWILLTWFTSDLLNYSNVTTPSLSKWLRPENNTEILTTLNSPNSWIIVNTKQSGYYRVNYDNENWQKIGRFLEKNFTQIHVLNRAQLIDDGFHLVLLKKLDAEIYWNMTKFLSNDKDYIAWYPMFKILEYISPIFVFHDEKIIQDLKLHLRSLLVSLLDQIKYYITLDEDEITECLREEAVKWACIFNDVNCLYDAHTQLRYYVDYRDTRRIPSGWRKWTFCEGLKQEPGCRSMIRYKALQAWDEKRDVTPLQCFISEDYYCVFDNPDTEQLFFINYFNIHIQPADKVFYFMFYLEKYANNKIDDILNNILNGRPGAITEITALNIIINNIYTPAGLQQIDKYAINKPSDIYSKISSKIDKRRKQLAKMMKYAHIFTKGMINKSN